MLLVNSNSEYLTNREWLGNVLKKEKNVILCHESALECLELFSGYVNESEINVYAKEKGIYDNINYRIVDSYDEIETVQMGELICTSASQTFNDMLREFESTDEQALIEGLSCYYFTNGQSFKKLNIEPENMERFEIMKQWALEYYMEG